MPGPIFWDQKHARALMQRYRDFLPSAPEELGSFLGLKTVLSTDPFPREHWGKRACALVSCYNGSAELGEKAMAPIVKDLPPPMFNWMGVIPFPSLQGMFDPFLPKGLQWYWKGDYVKALPDEAIDAHIAQAANTPSELSLMHLYPIDGAVHRIGKEETAWSARDATWSMVIAGIDPNPQKGIEAMGQGLLGSLASFQPGRRLRELHDGRRR